MYLCMRGVLVLYDATNAVSLHPPAGFNIFCSSATQLTGPKRPAPLEQQDCISRLGRTSGRDVREEEAEENAYVYSTLFFSVQITAGDVGEKKGVC